MRSLKCISWIYVAGIYQQIATLVRERVSHVLLHRDALRELVQSCSWGSDETVGPGSGHELCELFAGLAIMYHRGRSILWCNLGECIWEDLHPNFSRYLDSIAVLVNQLDMAHEKWSLNIYVRFHFTADRIHSYTLALICAYSLYNNVQ